MKFNFLIEAIAQTKNFYLFNVMLILSFTKLGFTPRQKIVLNLCAVVLCLLNVDFTNIVIGDLLPLVFAILNIVWSIS